ncbi:hypothetical protein OHA04_37375 [Streptomyces sp. NBC_01590]|uniref:hypothetical protein n=1 Tax=Streptomyces sp. NBC_01590 TaxID=2975887 RepID=UPI00386A7FBE
MTTHIEIAEARARELSDEPALFMLAYSAGWSVAADGGDVTAYARSLVDAPADAGFIEGAAAYRSRTARAEDFVPGSRAHVQYIRGNQ